MTTSFPIHDTYILRENIQNFVHQLVQSQKNLLKILKSFTLFRDLFCIYLFSVAYAGFSKGGGGGKQFRKFENNEDQNEKFSTQNQSVFVPKISGRPKKDLHSNLVRFLAQNWVKAKKKKDLNPPFVRSNLLPKLQRGGMLQFCIPFHANYTIWQPKGGPRPNAPL